MAIDGEMGCQFPINHQITRSSNHPILIAVLAVACAAAALAAQAPPDGDTFAKIRTEGLEHSQVDPVFRMLTVDIGPRLTASPAHKGAAEWMRDRLASYGLDHARLESWRFCRCWSLARWLSVLRPSKM